MGVMNQGLGGNRILHDIRGDSGLRRFDRDVLAQPGVTHAIVLLGTNDLRNRWAKPEEEANAPAMIAGLKQMALRAHARGIKIFGGTLTPFENETFLPGAWKPAREAVRQEVNAWIRAGRRVRCGDRFRRRACAIRNTRPACCRSGTAATTCTRAMPATTTWATSSIWRCSSEPSQRRPMT